MPSRIGNRFELGLPTVEHVLSAANHGISMRATTPSSGFSIGHIRLYVHSRSATSVTLTVGLMADAAGLPSGTFLVSNTITTPSANAWFDCIPSSHLLPDGTVYHTVARVDSIAGGTIGIRIGSIHHKFKAIDSTLDNNMNVLTTTNMSAWTTQNKQPLFIVDNGTSSTIWGNSYHVENQSGGIINGDTCLGQTIAFTEDFEILLVRLKLSKVSSPTVGVSYALLDSSNQVFHTGLFASASEVGSSFGWLQKKITVPFAITTANTGAFFSIMFHLQNFNATHTYILAYSTTTTGIPLAGGYGGSNSRQLSSFDALGSYTTVTTSDLLCEIIPLVRASGVITDDSLFQRPISGIRVDAVSASHSAFGFTQANGFYDVPMSVLGENYTITPSRNAGDTFTPSSLVASAVLDDVYKDFTIKWIPTLQYLKDRVDDKYKVSRLLPGKFVERLPGELVAYFDYIYSVALKEIRKTEHLPWAERAPISVLYRYIRELNLPIPSWIAPYRVGTLAKNAVEINKFRSSIRGWTIYLDSILDEPATVFVSFIRYPTAFFAPGSYGRMLPNWDELETYGTLEDRISYLYNFNMGAIIGVTIDSTEELTETQKQFIQDTSSYFIPMSLSEEVIVEFTFQTSSGLASILSIPGVPPPPGGGGGGHET